jgi:hypothetical protein
MLHANSHSAAGAALPQKNPRNTSKKHSWAAETCCALQFTRPSRRDISDLQFNQESCRRAVLPSFGHVPLTASGTTDTCWRYLPSLILPNGPTGGAGGTRQLPASPNSSQLWHESRPLKNKEIRYRACNCKSPSVSARLRV